MAGMMLPSMDQMMKYVVIGAGAGAVAFVVPSGAGFVPTGLSGVVAAARASPLGIGIHAAVGAAVVDGLGLVRLGAPSAPATQ